jgi:hypothetical protein
MSQKLPCPVAQDPFRSWQFRNRYLDGKSIALHDIMDFLSIKYTSYPFSSYWFKLPQPHGRAFKVLNKDAFVSSVISKYTTCTKYESFTRQLNSWGFKRLYQTGPGKLLYLLFRMCLFFLSRLFATNISTLLSTICVEIKAATTMNASCGGFQS